MRTAASRGLRPGRHSPRPGRGRGARRRTGSAAGRARSSGWMPRASPASWTTWSKSDAAPVGRQDADRDGDEAGDQHREQRQEEGRLGAIRQGREHRAVEEDRFAEIAAAATGPKKMPYCTMSGRSSPRRARNAAMSCCRRVGPEHHGGRIARRDAHDDEDDRDHDEHHGEHAEKRCMTYRLIRVHCKRGGVGERSFERSPDCRRFTP